MWLAATLAAMPAPPRHELRHVVAGDLGQEPVLAEMLDQEREPVLGALRARVMLPDFVPVAPGHIVEAQRCLCRRQLGNQCPRLLALCRFYFFGFTSRRAFRRAMKPMTVELEVEMPERRARTSVDGHGRPLGSGWR